jgi:hypothetical protein
MLHRAAVDGPDLEYELRGTGNRSSSSTAAQARYEPGRSRTSPLASSHRLLSYHRADFAGSSRLNEPATMATHAARCRRTRYHQGPT